MPSESQLIFITGANGSLGSQIVYQLLEKGYRVRGTVRPAKVSSTKNMFASYGDKFEVVQVNDITVDDISEHLNGVDKVIHAAAALPSVADAKIILKSAVEGSLNIIRQAEKAGIKKVVYTSSIVTVFNPNRSLTDKDWNPMTEEQALASPPWMAYIGAKTVAERAVWKFADEHKNIDITAINPPYLYGPFAPGFNTPKPDYSAISTNLRIYHFLTPKGTFGQAPGYADVRDVARIHVEALNSLPESSVGCKRLIVASPYPVNYKQAIQRIAEARPELRDRLVEADSVPEFAIDKLPVDLQRVADVTGVQIDSYHTWLDTVLDTVDGLLALEKDWISKGYKIDIPPLAAYGLSS